MTVNSDDPAYFGGYVTENFSALAAQAGLDRPTTCSGSPATRSRSPGSPPRARDGFLAELDAYLEGIRLTARR